MEKEQPIDEAALIASGKSMMEAGLGARFVLGKMKEAIADDEIRSRVMTAILEKQNPLEVKQSPQKVRHERKVRQAQFAMEDFSDAIQQLAKSSLVGSLTALLLIVSTVIFGAKSMVFVFFTLAAAIGLWLCKDKVNWQEYSTIWLLLGGGLVFYGVEFFLFGMPQRFIPGFGETDTHKVVNVLTVINDATPLVYVCIRLMMLFPFLLIFRKKQVLGNISQQYIEAAKKQSRLQF